MLSLVKQRASKRISSKAQSIVIILNKARKAPNLSLHVLFQIKIQHELYSSNTCAFTEIMQCHVYKSVSLPTANLPAFCNLTSLPAWIHTDKLILAVLSGTISIFSQDDITTVPISQLLLWDVFHVLVVPSWHIILEITFTELQGKNTTLSLNTERKKILKTFPEKRVNVSVAEKVEWNYVPRAHKGIHHSPFIKASQSRAFQ